MKKPFILLLFVIGIVETKAVPISDFIYGGIRGGDACICDTVKFTDISCCNIDGWKWDFGDPQSGPGNFAFTKTSYHHYATPGTYKVKLYISTGGVIQDSVIKNIIVCGDNKPTLIWHDTLVCRGNRIALFPIKPQIKYHWSTGDTTHTILVDTAGDYILYGDECECPCTADTAKLRFWPTPEAPFSRFTGTCSSGPYPLNAFNHGFRYIWSTGDTVQTIMAYMSGWYWVKIFNGHCELTDSTYLTLTNPPVLEIPLNINACSGDTLYLNPGWKFKEVLWNNSDTNHVLKVFKNGVYPLRVKYNSCDFTFFIYAVFNKGEEVDLGRDTQMCDGDTLTLNPKVSAIHYLWSTGDTLPEIKVYTSGRIWVRCDFQGCIKSDTILVDVATRYEPSVNPASYVCPEESNRVYSLALPPGTSVKWWDGSTLAMRNLPDSGWHSFTYANRCFAGVDSIYTGLFAKDSSLKVYGLMACYEEGEYIELTGKKSISYSWKPGNGHERKFRPENYGWITLNRKDSNACEIIDSFYISDLCIPDTLMIPNVFSPNNDSKNEVFKPSFVRYQHYEMRIFNRWGEELFMTNDYENGWDGNYQGRPCEEDVYIYYIEVSGYGKFRQLKGTVELVR